MIKNTITPIEKATSKKRKNEVFSEYMEHVGSEKLVLRCVECGTSLNFLADSSMETMKLFKGNFCGNRFCPMCAWRQSKKDGYMLGVCMDYIKSELKYDYLFLTLTTPNVTGENLKDEIGRYNKAFKELMRNKEVTRICKGYARKLEVTYAKHEFITEKLYTKKEKYYKFRGLAVGDKEPNFNTYNPHFHIIIAVVKSYNTRKDIAKGYISEAKWLELWQNAMKDNDKIIKQVKAQSVKENLGNEVFEIAKYSAKDTDYLHSLEVFKIFYHALKGKQVLVFGGCFKDAVAMYKNDELDQFKITPITDWVYMLSYLWQQKNYTQSDIVKLSIEEHLKYNNLEPTEEQKKIIEIEKLKNAKYNIQDEIKISKKLKEYYTRGKRGN